MVYTAQRLEFIPSLHCSGFTFLALVYTAQCLEFIALVYTAQGLQFYPRITLLSVTNYL
jgi:hypothetical protein